MKVIHSLKLKLTPARLRHLIRKLVFQPLHGFCMPCGPMSLVLGKPCKTLSASLEIFSIIIFISLRCFSCFVDTCHAPWTAHSYRGVPHQTLPHKCQPLSVRWETSRFPKRKHVVVFTFPCVFSILSLNWRKAYHSVTRMKVINCSSLPGSPNLLGRT